MYDKKLKKLAAIQKPVKQSAMQINRAIFWAEVLLNFFYINQYHTQSFWAYWSVYIIA